MKHFLLYLFLSLALGLSAQPAPDFTITDSNGQQHQLYDDYLNEGKTVVLKLFFTFCPPCNSIAPLLEPLYQTWGGGSNDVEFISISILSNDLNTAVSAYKSTHGLTFPGAGGDGNSVAATQPYTNGTYGFFLGTPTFVVIAPDGSVDYDPRGPNQQATIDSVSAAIAATGALMPFITYDGFGQVNTTDNEGINNVTIDIQNLNNLQLVTDTTGSFDFSSTIATDETYILTASKNNDSYTNGISTADLIKISQHILGVDTFTTPIQRIAADVDRNKKITTLDIIRLRKLILGIDTELANQQPWTFINANYQFNMPLNPFTEVYDGEATLVPIDPSESISLNFIGVKIGDVNDSADPGN
jgi:thiol-disulfide isomerase/thioredoxin